MPPLGSLPQNPLGAGAKGLSKEPPPRGLPAAFPTPSVSQAPREAPARRAPSSVLYLEEKSDQQKKEEVGTGGAWGPVYTWRLPLSCPGHPRGGQEPVSPPSDAQLGGGPSRAGVWGPGHLGPWCTSEHLSRHSWDSRAARQCVGLAPPSLSRCLFQ